MLLKNVPLKSHCTFKMYGSYCTILKNLKCHFTVSVKVFLLMWSRDEFRFPSKITLTKIDQIFKSNTRKYSLRGYFLAPPGQRKTITLKFNGKDGKGRTYIRTERRVSWNIILDDKCCVSKLANFMHFTRTLRNENN